MESNGRYLRLLKELSDLEKYTLRGFWIVPSSENMNHIDSLPPLSFLSDRTFLNNSTMGCLWARVSIHYLPLLQRYPNVPPQFCFRTPIYHVNIDRNGTLDASRSFQWSLTSRVSNILDYVKELFSAPKDGPLPGTMQTILNPEVARLRLQNPEEYQNKVRECVDASLRSVYQSQDGFAIKFDHYQPAVHDPIRNKLSELAESTPEQRADFDWRAFLEDAALPPPDRTEAPR
ncbi:hypothetical protein PAPYR_4669 [Paratrimastix pyriformis]|uniref:UBC core domain-containing protein n=1 Tax=Paratrimastix pyriformis TaxID=342808 RepID=A0ABQ8UKN0_9EUKA|nr:hypothetical protein PAPYR_4669 [Paratrimastix pyriformis]